MLTHEFKLKNNQVIGIMDDDLLLYIHDTLKWIVAEWNEFGNQHTGINYYGLTIYRNESLEQLVSVLKQWKTMFTLAPEQFILRGSFLLDEQEFERINCEKTNIIKQIDDIVCGCEEALRHGEIVIHYGI